jgi:hypothetical protein
MDMVGERIRLHGPIVSVRIAGPEGLALCHADGHEHALIFPSPFGGSGKIAEAVLFEKDGLQGIRIRYGSGDECTRFYRNDPSESSIEPARAAA